MSFVGFPFIVGWELTLACNLRCRHCGSSAGMPRANELTTDEALAICDQLPDLQVKEVDFTGGEPLVRSDWAAIAARLAALRIPTRMVTNGLCVDDRTVDVMRQVGLSGVGISLDGLEVTHDRIRGQAGVFARATAAMERLQQAGVSVTALTTANGWNVDELPAMLSWLVAAGVTRWQIQPVFPVGRVNDGHELRLTDDQYARFGALVGGWFGRSTELGVEVLPGDSFGYFTGRDTRQPRWGGCPAGIVSCGITADGHVKGCLSMPDELVEGSLRENDLWDIWFRPGAFAYTRDYEPDQLGPNCHGCRHADDCRGGCSTMSYGATGVFHNDPYCFHRIDGYPSVDNLERERKDADHESGCT